MGEWTAARLKAVHSLLITLQLCHPERTRWRVREGSHDTIGSAKASAGLAQLRAHSGVCPQDCIAGAS